MEWYKLKLFMSQATTLSMDALHLLAGLIGFLVVARLFKRPLSDARPWLAVFILELLNEWSDLSVELWPDVARQLGHGAKDILLTMVVPTVLMLVARNRPGMLTPSPVHEQVTDKN